MSKLYTLDEKLLTEVPEIRVGGKIYPVDNRQKTVAKLQAAVAAADGKEAQAGVAKALALALGPKAAAEIEGMNLPFPAYQKLFLLVMAAVTGEEADAAERRFQQAGR